MEEIKHTQGAKAEARERTPGEKVWDAETAYMGKMRTEVTYDEAKFLAENNNALAATAMVEGGYSQMSEEENRELARLVVQRDTGIASLMEPTRGGYSMAQLMKLITRAELSPEETMAQITKLMEKAEKMKGQSE